MLNFFFPAMPFCPAIVLDPASLHLRVCNAEVTFPVYIPFIAMESCKSMLYLVQHCCYLCSSHRGSQC